MATLAGHPTVASSRSPAIAKRPARSCSSRPSASAARCAPWSRSPRRSRRSSGRPMAPRSRSPRACATRRSTAPKRDADRPARRIRHLGWKYDNAGWIVDRPRSLFVVEASGMSPHRVLLTGGHDVGPSLSWTRDSTAIVIAHGGHETADVDRIVDLWSVPLDGGQPNRLTDGTQSWSQPVVSPEGDRIAAYRGEPRDPVRNARLVLLDPATGDATEVAARSRPWAFRHLADWCALRQ